MAVASPLDTSTQRDGSYCARDRYRVNGNESSPSFDDIKMLLSSREWPSISARRRRCKSSTRGAHCPRRNGLCTTSTTRWHREVDPVRLSEDGRERAIADASARSRCSALTAEAVAKWVQMRTDRRLAAKAGGPGHNMLQIVLVRAECEMTAGRTNVALYQNKSPSPVCSGTMTGQEGTS